MIKMQFVVKLCSVVQSCIDEMSHTTHAVLINCQCSSWGLSLSFSLAPFNKWNSFINAIATCPGYCHLHIIKKSVQISASTCPNKPKNYTKYRTPKNKKEQKITILFLVNIFCRSWDPVFNIQQRIYRIL